jgi:hypothetical protein
MRAPDALLGDAVEGQVQVGIKRGWVRAFAQGPIEAHPTSKLAGNPISAMALRKDGPKFLDLGHPPEVVVASPRCLLSPFSNRFRCMEAKGYCSDIRRLHVSHDE